MRGVPPPLIIIRTYDISAIPCSYLKITVTIRNNDLKDRVVLLFLCILRLCRMESIEGVIDLLHKKKAIRMKQFAETKRKQIEEYNDLIDTLQAMKDERINCIKTVSKNLESLTMHKHSIYKLVHNSENAPGLPISHNYHRQATTFLSEGIDFVNKSQSAYKNFDNDDKENNVNSIDLINDIALCTNTVGSELYMVESLIAEVKTLQMNADVRILFNCDDEDTDV